MSGRNDAIQMASVTAPPVSRNAPSFDWISDLSCWEVSATHESCEFALSDFLERSNLSLAQAWYVYFRRWCRVRRLEALELYDARALPAFCGIEMVLLMRRRASNESN